jgi:hypothetical protein
MQSAVREAYHGVVGVGNMAAAPISIPDVVVSRPQVSESLDAIPAVARSSPTVWQARRGFILGAAGALVALALVAVVAASRSGESTTLGAGPSEPKADASPSAEARDVPAVGSAANAVSIDALPTEAEAGISGGKVPGAGESGRPTSQHGNPMNIRKTPPATPAPVVRPAPTPKAPDLFDRRK